MTTPNSPGNPFAAPGTPTANQAAYPTPQAFADFLNKHWPGKRITGAGAPAGGNVGDQWLTWYAAESAKNPSYSLGQWEQAFFTVVAAHSLGDAVASAASATAQATQQAAKGIDTTNYNLPSPLAFLQGLTSANLWIRVIKVAVGGIMLVVGLAKLTGADKTAGGVVAKAVKVAPLL